MDLSAVFGAPFLSELAAHRPINTNASELSTSFNILLVVIALILWTQVPGIRAWLKRPVEVFLTIWGFLWFAWGTVSLGGLGDNLPLLSMVPAYRAIQVVGFIGIILFFLMLSHLAPIRRGIVITVAGVVGWLSLYGGSVLQFRELPKLPTWVIWSGGFGVGLCTFILLSWSRHFWPILVTVVLASLISVNSLPIQIGLGDFRNSAIAQRLLAMGSTARGNGEVWASNSLTFDSLMVATGVPSLSGFQRSGPDRDQWHRLDPTEKRIKSWNRSAGYARFNWQDGASLSISDNGFDVVWVTVDPCKLADLMPELTHIVSTKRLTAVCLTPSASYSWGQRRLTEYEITQGSG